jgi:hypothetical protein
MTTLDLRISTGLPTHPKTKKLRRRLGGDGAWALMCLWVFARVERPDGDLGGMSDEDIELAADWLGEPGLLVATLLEVRFIAGDEHARRIHDWGEHNPWSTGEEMRKWKARWNAIKRHHGEAEADRQVPEYAAIRAKDGPAASSNAASTATSNARNDTQQCTQHAASNAPSPSPSPSPSPKAQVGGTEARPERVAAIEPDPPSTTITPTPAGLACRAMRDVGIDRVNPSDPRLLALLAAGVTATELADTATECVSGGKPSYAYVLETVRARRAEAASREPVATGPPGVRALPSKTATAYAAMEIRKRAFETSDDDPARMVSGPD